MKVYAGAPAAARHYVESGRGRADDYYLTEGTDVARRFTAAGGRVEELAPLTGDGYEAWVAGVDPETAAPWGRLREDDRAVRFVEVVVNGPKSWSLAAALHPDIAEAYDAAQDRAAEQIVGWLGEHATTRVGPRGGQVQVPVEALHAVTVRHCTSRAGDPHRHLHLQINARVFAAGKWRGLHTVGVRDSLAAINGIGHAAVATDPHLRAALAAHGYALDGSGEILQLAEYVGPFSARTVQIARNMGHYEREWRQVNPGEQPGPALHRRWDARAWAEDRPDKGRRRPAANVTARWLAELRALGYRDRDIAMALTPAPIGGLDRDAVAQDVLTRLAVSRSAWNAADIRGEVEQTVAGQGIVADAAVRIELAEDLTARSLDRCVPLLLQAGVLPAVPDHIRAWTSQPVLDVEAELTDRLAARTLSRETDTAGIRPAVLPAQRLDADQADAVTALAGGKPLVVIEGAAGAGKTTTLAATRRLLEEQGRGLIVVTPTLKAAKVARAEVGTAAGSVAWLVFQHGWRWTEDGTWTRLAAGEADPVTGALYAGPGASARLCRGDLLVVDEAGMLDQDTARALLTVADECQVRLALLGDRHQLAAVGRGGVLDLAARAVDPTAHLTLETVHRFTRTEGTGVTLPDREYADLTRAMRTGEDAGAVFDALLARGQVRLHAAQGALTEALAGTAAASYAEGVRVAVVVDTREQVAELNAAIRERLVTAGRIQDSTVVTTRAGQRIGVGDWITTRRNDRDLDVANRDTWTVGGVGGDGELVVTPVDVTPTARGRGSVTPAAARQRVLPAGYVTAQVELAYASTAHGVQGDTVPAAHVVIGERTGAASAYVGMTRGRQKNTAHLVAADVADAREQWIAVFARDRADLGPAHAAELAAREAARYVPTRPLEQVLADLHEAWTAEQHAELRLAITQPLRDRLRQLVELGGNPVQRLEGRLARERQAGRNVDHADRQVRAVEVILRGDADRIRQQLIDAWDGQRDGASQAAAVVLQGAGRLGQRRRAVTRAGEELTEWADIWRPYLPDLPADPRAIAEHADSFDDRAALWRAFDDAARRGAEGAHPEQAALRSAAATARNAHARATRARGEGRRERDEMVARFGRVAHTPDPAAKLVEVDREITAAGCDLAATRARIEHLTGEPAFRGQPPDRIVRERDAWRARRDADRNRDRHSPGTPRPPDPYVLDRSRSAGRSGPGLGR
ncbi:MobF family relaxase [Modestobacter excelsi]|uniref:MobF family relaxase n=1 Tax=Modestobacter excelsi TaxID=2213161 RepID=UPI00110D0E66|nr:MobF family relaxase [Modestobacter excelsi]